MKILKIALFSMLPMISSISYAAGYGSFGCCGSDNRCGQFISRSYTYPSSYYYIGSGYYQSVNDANPYYYSFYSYYGYPYNDPYESNLFFRFKN